MPFWKGKSCRGSVTVVEHSKRCQQEGVTDDRKCDNPKRGVKNIREVSQLTERCDGYGRGVRRYGKV